MTAYSEISTFLLARRKTILYIIVALLLCFTIYIQFLAGMTGDKDWLLYATRMWLSGKRLYLDTYLDINTPLTIWLYGLPVYVAVHSGGWLKDYQALVFTGLCVTAFSIFICARIIRRHPQFTGNDSRYWQFVGLLVFTLIFYTSPFYFFHREHIFLLLALPYMFRLMPSLVNAPLPLGLRIVIGCMAGVGFCLKPHLLIVLAGMQLLTIFRERSLAVLLSVENCLIYALGLLYLAAVWHFTPNYFATILPMALATYSACSVRMSGIFWFSQALFIFGVTFVDFRLRYTTPYRRDIYYLLGICVLLLAYAVANNGWGYTYNLLITFILIVTGWVLWDFIYLREDHAARGLLIKPFVFGARACGLNLLANAGLAFYTLASFLAVDCGDHTECQVGHVLIDEVKTPDHVYSFGTVSVNFMQWVILSNKSGAKWEMHFHHLWMLPKFFGSDEAFARDHRWILEYVANILEQDMDIKKPEIMFVDDTSKFYSVNKHVDLIAYLSAFPQFKKAWQHYRYMHSINNCVKDKGIGMGKVVTPAEKIPACSYYDVYKRQPE